MPTPVSVFKIKQRTDSPPQTATYFAFPLNEIPVVKTKITVISMPIRKLLKSIPDMIPPKRELVKMRNIPLSERNENDQKNYALEEKAKVSQQ